MRIRDNGMKGFYEGETAKLIVDEMQRGQGLVSYDDLKIILLRHERLLSLITEGIMLLASLLRAAGEF